MKLTLLPLFALATGFPMADNKAACAAKNGELMDTIQAFCGGTTNMVVPSDYAGNDKGGAFSADEHSFIYINGPDCDKESVPQNVCFNNFYDMCAQGGKHGGSTASYGLGGCQKWTISYLRHAY